MTLVNIVVILVVVGLVMWLINTYIPMAGAIKSLLNIVVFVVVLIWILQTFGIIGRDTRGQDSGFEVIRSTDIQAIILPVTERRSPRGDG